MADRRTATGKPNTAKRQQDDARDPVKLAWEVLSVLAPLDRLTRAASADSPGDDRVAIAVANVVAGEKTKAALGRVRDAVAELRSLLGDAVLQVRAAHFVEAILSDDHPSARQQTPKLDAFVARLVRDARDRGLDLDEGRATTIATAAVTVTKLRGLSPDHRVKSRDERIADAVCEAVGIHGVTGATVLEIRRMLKSKKSRRGGVVRDPVAQAIWEFDLDSQDRDATALALRATLGRWLPADADIEPAVDAARHAVGMHDPRKETSATSGSSQGTTETDSRRRKPSRPRGHA